MKNIPDNTDTFKTVHLRGVTAPRLIAVGLGQPAGATGRGAAEQGIRLQKPAQSQCSSLCHHLLWCLRFHPGSLLFILPEGTESVSCVLETDAELIRQIQNTF